MINSILLVLIFALDADPGFGGDSVDGPAVVERFLPPVVFELSGSARPLAGFEPEHGLWLAAHRADVAAAEDVAAPGWQPAQPVLLEPPAPVPLGGGALFLATAAVALTSIAIWGKQK